MRLADASPAFGSATRAPALGDKRWRGWPSGGRGASPCSVTLRAGFTEVSPTNRRFPAGRPGAGVGAGGPGRTDETGSWCPGWRHRVAPLEPRSWIAPSVKGARTPWSGRGESIARGSSPRCSKRAHACAEDGDPSPRHDRFLGTRVGEASNPGHAPLDPCPAFNSLFATFGEGWVAFVFQGLHDRGGSPTLSFKAVAPLGGRAATFRVLGEDHLFSSLLAGQAYVCAEARPVFPHWEGAHEFHVGHPGSRTAAVGVRMAPSGLAWTTGDPKREGGPWTHADLACGIGGFTVAAQALGATTTWACDVNRTAVEAYNAAHGRGHTHPAECHPIELRARWSRHVGTDVVSAGFPCHAFSRVGFRQGYRDARGQVMFHFIQL